MKPAAFRSALQAAGPAGRREVARLAGITPGQLSSAYMRRPIPAWAPALRVPPYVLRAFAAWRQEGRDQRWRAARRSRAEAAWEGRGERPAIHAAAAILDGAGEPLLADWLLRASPERFCEVATGVAVHAMLRLAEPGSAVFDTLQHAGLLDLDAFDAAYFDERLYPPRSEAFGWSPPAGSLIP